MGGVNRDRITVTLGGAWRLYQYAPPPGWEVLGVVHRGLEAGALARSRSGQLVQLNAGSARSLDQRKALAALHAAQDAAVAPALPSLD